MSKNILCIISASRRHGNTGKMVDALLTHLPNVRLMDLNDFAIAPYRYEPQDDDFTQIALAVQKTNVIILATPIYWYSMSGQMKIFFDRLTDLTEEHKVIGKQLAGKHVFGVFAGGTMPSDFEMPFRKTAHYFDMHWGGYWFEQLSQTLPLSSTQLANALSLSETITSVLPANNAQHPHNPSIVM